MASEHSTLDETQKFLEEARLASEDMNRRVSEHGGINECYFQGIQWLGQANDHVGNRIRRWATDFNPSSPKLRVTDNDLTRLVIKARTATYPSQLHADIEPMIDSSGLDDRATAKSAESFLNMMVDDSSFLEHAQQANDNRAIRGTYGIGLRMDAVSRNVKGKRQRDVVIKAFCFEPHHLILDPGNQSRNLRDHEYVIYWTVLTRDKIRRMYGIELGEKQTTPMGQLLATELSFSHISGGRLYADIQAHSRTPSAIVYEIYRKGDDSRRFSTMEVRIDAANTKVMIDPFEGDESDKNPWGGDGLPFIELFGHRRGDSRQGIADVDMMREDQDRRNLLASLLFRTVQKSAHYIWRAEKAWFEKSSDDDVRNQLTNLVGGIILGKGSDNRRNIQPPTIVDVPQPPAILETMIQLRSDQMREKAFRAEVQFGKTKSHVPATTERQAARSADDVASIRVAGDIVQYERLLMVMLGTGLELIHAKSPTTAAELDRAGFSEKRVASLIRLDRERPQLRLSLREASVRFRSHDDKRADVDQAVRDQVIDPARFRLILAKELDTPITGNDRRMSNSASEAADAIIRGMEWEAQPLGEYAGYFTDEFRAGLTDSRVDSDPEAKARLIAAIEAQDEFDAQRAVRLDPNFIAAQLQAEQQQPAQEEQSDTVDIASLVQQATQQPVAR